MAEFKTDQDLTPGEEKLLRIKEKEEQIRKELDEELNKRKKELEALQKEAEEEIKEIKDLEKRTQREIEIEKDVEDLEERIKDIKTVIEKTQGDEASYYNSSPRFEGINKNMDYLLNAEYISQDKRLEAERELYKEFRDMRKNLGEMAQESYAFNDMMQKFEQLNSREGQDNFGYMKRIRNMLGSLDEYVSGGK